MMQDEMIEGMGGMMWGMGLFGMLILILVILLIIALLKYLFFDKRTPGKND